MAYSLSARLGLKRPLPNHDFDRQEAYDNLTVIDAHPGVYPCTELSRPSTWGAAHEGMVILETDTALMWRWNGLDFLRVMPMGLLADPAVRTTDFSTAATTPDSALSLTVDVPETNTSSTTKRIRIDGTFYAIENGTDTTYGVSEVTILRDAVVVAKMRVTGRPATDTDYLDWGQGRTFTAFDNPPAGNYTYHLSINSVAAVGGTTVLKASATQVAQLAVTEVGL
jgi:hypothetical protein